MNLFLRAKKRPRQLDPLPSLLVPRDGRKSGRELEPFKGACKKLAGHNMLAEECSVQVVDLHKKSVKGIRMWEIDADGAAENTLEGSGLQLDGATVVLQNTGCATLTQGTAEPIMLVARGKLPDRKAVAEDIHNGFQLNYSNPRVPQRLPLELKRTDDEIKKPLRSRDPTPSVKGLQSRPFGGSKP